MPSSLHQGSVRWMAPELMFAMVEDSGLNMGGSGHSAEGVTSHSPQRCLPVTRYSDVYAFASVCLEVSDKQLISIHRITKANITHLLGAHRRIALSKPPRLWYPNRPNAWNQTYSRVCLVCRCWGDEWSMDADEPVLGVSSTCKTDYARDARLFE